MIPDVQQFPVGAPYDPFGHLLSKIRKASYLVNNDRLGAEANGSEDPEQESSPEAPSGPHALSGATETPGTGLSRRPIYAMPGGEHTVQNTSVTRVTRQARPMPSGPVTERLAIESGRP